MSTDEFRERSRLSEAIQSCRAAVAEEVTEEFLARYPEWLERYGDRARRFGIEDAGYHLDFLAGAIESGETEAFNEYSEWAARMLMSRHIAPQFLAENLQQIGRALRARLAAPDADAVDSFVRSGVARCLDGGTKTDQSTLEELPPLIRMYTDAAIRGNRRAALNLLLEAVGRGHMVIDLYAEVLQGAMYRIGRLWEEGKITVAQEHMATAITQFVIAHLYSLIDPPEMSLGKGVITGVPGEFHQVGANMVADMLEADGWDMRFLGTDTPISSVLEAVEEHQADILGISATMLFRISSVARLIDAVRAKSGDRIRIMVGGAAFRSSPLLYRELGADCCGHDLRTAVALARDLAALRGAGEDAKSVLVADDDAGVRKWLRHVLEESGYRVLEADNGRTAMRLLREQEVHLVLMDIIMPEQEGLETIPQIRANFPAVKVIAMSGAFNLAFLHAARALGAADIFTKPITPETVVNKVRQVLAG